jgi:flagellar hook-associated protein 3 FlgL
MRNFALAAVIGIELMDSPISSEVRAAVNATAIEYAGQAVTGIDNERSISVSRKTGSPRPTFRIESQIRSSSCI